MKNKRNIKARKVGLTPGTPIYTGKKYDKKLLIDVFTYNENSFREVKINHLEDLNSIINTKDCVWINIHGLNDIETIKQVGLIFNFHDLLLEDVVNINQRPKLDEYEDYLLAVIKMLHFNESNNLAIEQVSFVLGSNFLITFQEFEGDVFDIIRERIRLNKGMVRKMGIDYLMYALIDIIVDNYFLLTDDLALEVEQLETRLLNESANTELVKEIQGLKHNILKIRRAIYPQREVIGSLITLETDLINSKTHLYLNDLKDHMHLISENIEIYREMISSLMDMYLTTLSNKMNEVMKLLTIIATIFIPLTFIAGIYGMNFENIPELKYKYAYYILWGIMLAIFLGMLYYFRRKKWL